MGNILVKSELLCLTGCDDDYDDDGDVLCNNLNEKH